MSKYLYVFSAAVLFGACVFLALFGKPQPTSYTGWERDVGCAVTGGLFLLLAAPAWAASRALFLVALALAIIPAIVMVFSSPFPIL